MTPEEVFDKYIPADDIEWTGYVRMHKSVPIAMMQEYHQSQLHEQEMEEVLKTKGVDLMPTMDGNLFTGAFEAGWQAAMNKKNLISHEMNMEELIDDIGDGYSEDKNENKCFRDGLIIGWRSAMNKRLPSEEEIKEMCKEYDSKFRGQPSDYTAGKGVGNLDGAMWVINKMKGDKK